MNIMNIYCQKHPTENLYFGQMTLEQLQTLMPNIQFNKLKGNNITLNIRETGCEAVMFNEIEFELSGNTHGGYGFVTIKPDCVDCSVVASSPIGNQADGGEIFNVTLQSFKKKVPVRITQELLSQILTFPTNGDGGEGAYEGAYQLVSQLKEELKLLML